MATKKRTPAEELDQFEIIEHSLASGNTVFFTDIKLALAAEILKLVDRANKLTVQLESKLMIESIVKK